MTNRLFIAFDIPESIQAELITLRDSLYGLPNDIKWEEIDKFHVTIKFLGDVGENLTDLILRRLEEVEFNQILTSFSNFAFFKKFGSLKILYTKLENNKNIQEFYKVIENECELLGFEKENRKYHPHLTLLRIKNDINLNKLLIFNNFEIPNLSFKINSFSIIKSKLKLTGSEYSVIKSFKLL